MNYSTNRFGKCGKQCFSIKKIYLARGNQKWGDVGQRVKVSDTKNKGNKSENKWNYIKLKACTAMEKTI